MAGYNDDTFFVWTHGAENVSIFMKDFSNFKSNLKLTFKYNRNSVNFLNFNEKLNNGELTTSVYIKPT